MGDTVRMSKQAAKIAGIVFLLIVLIVLGDIITGAVSSRAATPLSITSCNNPSSLEQCGTGSCIPIGAPVISCGVTINFSPVFATVPRFFSATVTGCNNACHTDTQPAPTGSISLQSDNGETWISMPAAKTEIYGTVNHESGFITTTSTNEAFFTVNCLTGSSSATAKLRPEFSTTFGASWFELASNTGTLDVPVDAANCSFTPSGVVTVGPSGINATAVGVNIELRAVGINGGGVGDNPVFNNVQIVFFSIISQMYLVCIQAIPAPPNIGCGGTSSVSKSSMMVTITRMMPALSGGATSVSFTWMAEE